MDFNSLFRKAVDSGASDIHLQGGRRPIVRLHGTLVRSEGAALADEELRAQISRMLPEHLRGNVRKEEGGGRRPAIELLRGGPVTEKYIMEGKLTQLTEYIEGGESGMQSFDQHLLQMFGQRLVSGQEALKNANRPEALATAMRGIKYTCRAL